MTAINRRPKPFTAVLAAVVLGVVGLGAAATAGLRAAALAVVAFAGTALFVRGITLATADPDETTNAEWALSSLAIAVGAMVALLPLFKFDPATAALVYPFVAAVAFAGVGSSAALVGDRTHHVNRLCWRNRDALAVATLLSVLLHTGALARLGSVSVRLGSAVVSRNAMLSLLALEALAVVLLVVLPRAQRVLEEEVATPEARRIAGITVDGRRIDRVLPAVRRRLPGYWWVFAGQILVLFVFPGLLGGVLSGLPVFGPALRAVLTAGVVHLAVAVVVALATLVLVASGIRSAVVSWATVDPPRMLASAVGGVVLSVGVLLPGHLLAGPTSAVLFDGTSLARTAAVYGPAAVVLVALALLTFALPIVLVGADMLVSVSRLATERSGAFVVASALGLVGTVVAAAQGATAVVVFAGVAASILAWEFGHQASYLGTHLGSAVQTREVEVVHAVAALAVGVAGIALAGVVGYVLGPIDLPTGSDRAYLALALALLSALSFLLALDG